MGMIFDSCIWVGLAAHQVDRQAVIDAAGVEPIFTSAISLGELGYGVQSCSDPRERAIRAAYLRQVESRPTLDISKHTAAAFAVLAAAVKIAGRSPRPRYNDLWITQFVMILAEVVHLDPAFFNQGFQAKVDAADIDANFISQGALRHARVLLEQFECPKQGVVVCGLAAGVHRVNWVWNVLGAERLSIQSGYRGQ